MVVGSRASPRMHDIDSTLWLYRARRENSILLPASYASAFRTKIPTLSSILRLGKDHANVVVLALISASKSQ